MKKIKNSDDIIVNGQRYTPVKKRFKFKLISINELDGFQCGGISECKSLQDLMKVLKDCEIESELKNNKIIIKDAEELISSWNLDFTNCGCEITFE